MFAMRRHLLAAVLLASVACGGGGGGEGEAPPPQLGPCAGVTCSGHGTCHVEGTLPACSCEAGYHDSALDCVPTSGRSAGSCSLSAADACVEYTGSLYTSADVREACALFTGATYSASSCTSTGSVGRCSTDPGRDSEIVATYYAPLDAEALEQSCEGRGGVWTPGSTR